MSEIKLDILAIKNGFSNSMLEGTMEISEFIDFIKGVVDDYDDEESFLLLQLNEMTNFWLGKN